VTRCPCRQVCSPALLRSLMITQINAFQRGTTPKIASFPGEIWAPTLYIVPRVHPSPKPKQHLIIIIIQINIHTYIHTYIHPFNGLLSGTTRVSRYQKGKTNLDFTEARDSEWQWHQLGDMQSVPRCSQITTPAPHHSVFYKPDALPAAQPTVSKQ